MTKCPECGGQLMNTVEGSTLIVSCKNCNRSVATTYIFPPIKCNNYPSALLSHNISGPNHGGVFLKIPSFLKSQNKAHLNQKKVPVMRLMHDRNFFAFM